VLGRQRRQFLGLGPEERISATQQRANPPLRNGGKDRLEVSRARTKMRPEVRGFRTAFRPSHIPVQRRVNTAGWVSAISAN
jgi:hypothetical protein